MNPTRTLVLALVVCALQGCSNDTQTRDTKLVLTGSSTVAPLAAELGRRFEADNPGVRIDVQTGGSTRGIIDARKGLADIGMVSRALKDDEQGLTATTIARDGICLIVHRDNPVTQLDDDTVRRIFRGEIKDWSEVGGPSGTITVVNKAEGRSTLELFLSFYKLKGPRVKADVIIGDNEQGILTVSGNPGAIGYVSIGTAEYNAKTETAAIRLLPVGGIKADTAHVLDGSFPLSRPLNFVTSKPPEGLAKRFIDFARSEAVHDIVRQQFFVPIGG